MLACNLGGTIIKRIRSERQVCHSKSVGVIRKTASPGSRELNSSLKQATSTVAGSTSVLCNPGCYYFIQPLAMIYSELLTMFVHER